jgi:hypothetical protein
MIANSRLRDFFFFFVVVFARTLVGGSVLVDLVMYFALSIDV